MAKSATRKRKLKFMQQSLRFPVAILYILIVILILSEDLLSSQRYLTLNIEDWCFLGAGFFVLLFLEWLESRYHPKQLNLPMRLTLLAVRIFCITAIFRVNVTDTSPAISALLIYTIYFYFGLFPVLLVFAGISGLYVFNPALFQAGFISEIAIMIYMFLFAIVIKHDDRTRLRNLDLYQELETYAGNTASIAKQDERNRISRELHDTLGHYLVGMNIQLQKAAAYREIDLEESYLAVEKAREASSDAMRELRQTLSNLREMEETYDFKQEIEKMLSAVKENNLEVNFVYNGNPDGYSELVLTTLQRAVQEGLTNVQKHSQATQVDLRIDFTRREASLLLEDNGVGFSNRDREKDGHYGLNGLEERIDLVGGKIRIQSRKDKGTKIKINIPKRLFS